MQATSFVRGPWGEPPAPVVEVAVRPLYGGPAYQGPALMDTGATCCLVPRSFIEERRWRCRGVRRVLTPTGVREMLVYAVALEAFSRQWDVEAIASERPYAIIGRRVLNELKLLLDGPQGVFSVVT